MQGSRTPLSPRGNAPPDPRIRRGTAWRTPAAPARHWLRRDPVARSGPSMRSPRSSSLLASALLLTVTAPAAAAEQPATAPPAPAAAVAPPAPEPFPTRSFRIGPSFQVQYYEPFEGTRPFGPGLFSAYEFYLSPSFALGINLSYRFYPGAEQEHQLGYGLLLKHYLGGTRDPEAVFMPFLAYGLLLQITWQSAQKGSGTSHDTRLSAGTDLRLFRQIFFVEGAWHYSRLGLFESPSYKLDALELDIGYRYPW